MLSVAISALLGWDLTLLLSLSPAPSLPPSSPPSISQVMMGNWRFLTGSDTVLFLRLSCCEEACWFIICIKALRGTRRPMLLLGSARVWLTFEKHIYWQWVGSWCKWEFWGDLFTTKNRGKNPLHNNGGDTSEAACAAALPGYLYQSYCQAPPPPQFSNRCTCWRRLVLEFICVDDLSNEQPLANAEELKQQVCHHCY